MIRSLSILSFFFLLIFYSLLEICVSSDNTTVDVISSQDGVQVVREEGDPNVASRNRVATTIDVISSQDNSTKIGIQVERDEGYPNVKSQDRIAILTNPSGLFPDSLEHIVDVLNREFPSVVQLVLAPEHGTLTSSKHQRERLPRRRQDFEVINKRRAVILTRM